MKLATFTHGGTTRIGVVQGEHLIDLSLAAPELPVNMVSFLEAGENAISTARSVACQTKALISLDDVRLEAPVLRPRKFLGIGWNFPREDIQSNEHQVWFNKQVTCVNGPFDPVQIPKVSDEVTFGVELAFVIGTRCRHVPREKTPLVIAGYMICNDLTVIDWKMHSPTATLGKSFDTHGPIGPWLVTADELGDPFSLELSSYVNGEELQRGNTADMLVNCFEIVPYLSSVFTLEPGDILSMGTPTRTNRILKAGDVVRCEIDGIGHIENPVVKEE